MLQRRCHPDALHSRCTVTLSGALSVQAGPGTQTQRFANGDTRIGIKAAWVIERHCFFAHPAFR